MSVIDLATSHVLELYQVVLCCIKSCYGQKLSELRSGTVPKLQISRIFQCRFMALTNSAIVVLNYMEFFRRVKFLESH